MELIYNNVKLKIGRVNAFQQKAVYTEDGADYLYTHFYINVQCVFNPFATTSVTGTVNDIGKLFYIGRDDPQTALMQLRHRLEEPRRTLEIRNGGFLMLKSPPEIAEVDTGGNIIGTHSVGIDAKVGPHPINLSIVEIHGAKTIVCNYEIETWLNECDTFDGAVLANRWQMTEELDERFLSVRTVSGTAYFRQDVMAATNTTPDDYRNALVVPTPDTGFKRTSIRISVDENNCAVRYEAVDEEQVMNIIPGKGIVAIKGYQTYETDWQNIIPMFVWEVVFSIWGEKRTTRRELVKRCIEVLISLSGKYFKGPLTIADNGANIIPFSRAGVRVALEERRADCWFNFRASAAFLAGSDAVNNWKDTFSFMRGMSDDAANAWVESVSDFATTSVVKNVSPPASMGTRGNQLARIFAQVLTAPCGSMVAPPFVPPTTQQIVATYGNTSDVSITTGG